MVVQEDFHQDWEWQKHLESGLN